MTKRSGFVLLASIHLLACAGVPGYAPAGSLGRGRPHALALRAGAPSLRGDFRVRDGDLPAVDRGFGLERGLSTGASWIFESGPGGLRLDLDHEQWDGEADLGGRKAVWKGAALSGPVESRLALTRLDLSVSSPAELSARRFAIGAQLIHTAWSVRPGPAGGEEWSLAPWLGTGLEFGGRPSPLSLACDFRLGVPGQFPVFDRYLDWLASARADLRLVFRGGELRAGYGWDAFTDLGHRGERGRFIRHGPQLGLTWSF